MKYAILIVGGFYNGHYLVRTGYNGWHETTTNISEALIRDRETIERCLSMYRRDAQYAYLNGSTWTLVEVA